MNNYENQFKLSNITLALSMTLAAGLPGQLLAQQSSEEEAIEEVVVKASRLKGTASAVMEERKNQAFVADILGAEQIGRTGDSDAAAALRRVTGLTLVDGKFIYVRGLGERYSSTQLNGAAVPSPDPTRTVIPLDLFPAPTIESLSVQKAYSASMPGHFGGGNVDIRLKSVPSDFVFNTAFKLGSNSENWGNGFTYNGGGDDWQGIDDGTRQAPAALRQLWQTKTSLNELSQEANRQIAADINRDYDPYDESLDPDYGVDATLGDRFELNDKFTLGYLSSISYNNEWQYSEGYEGQDYTRQQDGSFDLLRGFDDVKTTEHRVRWSGMLSLGLEYNRDHKINYIHTILHDTNDQIDDKIGVTNNIKRSDGQQVRDSEVTYEERRLMVNQLHGQHTFSDYWFIGLDWKYSEGRSYRDAPGNIGTRYIISDENQDGLFELTGESSLRRATTASRLTWQNLHDKVENWGFNLSLPLTFETSELELKYGADFIEKSRDAYSRRIDYNSQALPKTDLSGWRFNDILTDEVILNDPLRGTDLIIRDTTITGDDYLSAQMTDAYYGEADYFYDNTWRITAGVRWEDYRQVVAPIDPATGQFDLPDPNNPTEQDLLDLTYQEEDLFPSLALTYQLNETMQLRLSYGESAVRPDIREVAQTTYIDPLTEFPVRGTAGIRSTEIQHIDARWEWYLETGENLSVGLFYKDMVDPIESVQSPAQDGPPLIVMANAEDGYVYGVEVEFMKDFNFLGQWGESFFLNGNVTLSDSEVNIDPEKVVEQTGVSTSITNTTRRMTGHSEYVVNLNLGFDSPNGNHSATLAYNVFGDRIIIPGIDFIDDSYEQPFHSLDLVYTYFPTYSSQLKFRVQNILDEEKEIEFEDTLLRSETIGTSFRISYRVDFD
jgi:TonB-dependent receptor